MGKNKTIIILSVLLVITLVYIAFSEYGDWKQEKELGIFQQGAQYGYEQAFIQIVEQALTCEQVPLRIGNDTINVRAVGCPEEAE